MTVLIIGTIALLVTAGLDAISSIAMKKYGIKESVPLVADKNGDFSLVKGACFIAAPLAVAWLLYLLGPVEEAASGYHRNYAGWFLFIGAAAHGFAYLSNRRKIAKAIETRVSGSGII